MGLPTILNFAHGLVGQPLRPGGIAVDATVGNGHDTLFLAERVGSSGLVYGFDVQEAALSATRLRLMEREMEPRVRLHDCGHERMRDILPPDAFGRVQAVMFNLGYLPGAQDKTMITRPETTLAALHIALDIITPSGVITVVLYHAHGGGAEEAEVVEQWATGLSHDAFMVYSYAPLNARRLAPRLIAVEKRG